MHRPCLNWPVRVLLQGRNTKYAAPIKKTNGQSRRLRYQSNVLAQFLESGMVDELSHGEERFFARPVKLTTLFRGERLFIFLMLQETHGKIDEIPEYACQQFDFTPQQG